MSIENTEKLKSLVRPLDHDVYNYTSLQIFGVDQLTERSALVTSRHLSKDEWTTCWLPISILRKDLNNELWLQTWFYKREFLTTEEKE